MRKQWAKRLLVGAIALTTFFSTFGSSAVYAVDGESAVIAESDEYPSLKDISFAEQVEDAPAVAASDSASNEDSDTGAAEASAATEGASEEGSTEASDAGSEGKNDAASGEASDEAAAEASSDVSDAASEASSEETGDGAGEASTEATESASFESSEDGAADAAAEASSEGSEQNLRSNIPNDLSNPEFGYVENIELPSEIGDIGEKITLKFDFHVYNAESIPDGKFTYILPKQLDFSSMINDIKISDGNKVIGKASIGTDNVITFEIDPEYLLNKPNGINGHVGLECTIAKGVGDEDEEVAIDFSDGSTIKITVKEPTITAKKDPVEIKDGKAMFKVEFDVSGDTDNFEITDELGSNLFFVDGSWSFRKEGSDENIPCDYTLVDEHTLKVNVGKIKKGKYVLRYTIKPEEFFSTSGMSVEDIIAKGNGNLATWNWKESAAEHKVQSYAKCGGQSWIYKEGTNGQKTGTVSAKGETSWTIYLNRGSNLRPVAGKTLVDYLDPNMEFINIPIIIKASKDQKSWNKIYEVYPQYDEAKGCSYFSFTFPEDAPACYYKINYNTRIKGELPNYRTKYVNNAYLYDDVLIGQSDAANIYDHVGVFQASMAKHVNKERDPETGKVGWKSEFSIEGNRNNYSVTITDIIAPAAGSEVVNGKKVGAKILEGVKLYRVDDSGEVVEEIKNFSVKITDNSYTLTASKLVPGKYVIFYETQDYYGNADNHSFPGGSSLEFINKAKLIIDGSTFPAEDSYHVNSEGLPMRKEAQNGYYSEDGYFAVPWKVYINRNELGQTNELIADGAETVVTDYLPDKLIYKKGSAVFKKPSGEEFSMDPVEKKGDHGDTVLTWKFNWKKAESEKAENNYYVLTFVSYVDKAYFDSMKEKNKNGSFTLSFDNDVTGTAGGNSGSANASSKDDISLINKTSSFNDAEQLIDYTVVVNREGIDLLKKGDKITVSDTLTNGTFVTGSLKVYNYKTNEPYEFDASTVVEKGNGRYFSVVLPDNMPLVVKYSVKPDLKKGEKGNDSKVDIEVSNVATLHADGTYSSEVGKVYSVEDVSADITSNKGSVKIIKVDADAELKGLAGCTIGLFRVDAKNKAVKKIATKKTDDIDASVIFDVDGKYDSLIFDTLYYFQEIEAPKGYKIDKTKNYFIFRGTKFDKNIEDIKKYVGDDFERVIVIDITKSGSEYEFTFKNKKSTKPDPKEEPENPDKPKPTDPTEPTPSEPETTEDGGQVVTTSSVVTPDLPDVLGVYKEDEAVSDLPDVMGAYRRGNTSDRDMTSSYVILLIAMAVLVVTLTKVHKDNKIKK